MPPAGEPGGRTAQWRRLLVVFVEDLLFFLGGLLQRVGDRLAFEEDAVDRVHPDVTLSALVGELGGVGIGQTGDERAIDRIVLVGVGQTGLGFRR